MMKAAGPSVEEAAKRQYKTGTLGCVAPLGCVWHV